MNEKVKIDFVSDVVCPWCAIGYKRFEQAVKELGVEERIKLEFQPFELNPNMVKEGENLRQHLAQKYGTTREDSIRARKNITQLGAEVGFKFDYSDEMKMFNTKHSHLLLQFAAQHGKQQALKIALFDAFFGQRQDISDKVVLESLLLKLGLPVKEGLATLDDERAMQLLKKTEDHWTNLGIYSVPTIVLNEREAVTGAQSVGTYKQVLREYLKV